MSAAARTFGAPPSLALSESTPRDAGVTADRKRLAGAFLLPLDRIRPDREQPRQTLRSDELDELTASIRELGVLQPVTVRLLPEEDTYQLISGERRYRAARAAGLAEMPCWVQSPSDEEILLRQVVENWQRAELHPFDLADSLARLRDAHGLTQKEVARRTGKPESEVSRLIALLKLHPAVQREGRADTKGELGKRLLATVAQLPVEQQPELLRIVREQQLTTPQVEAWVRERKAAAQGERRRGAPSAQHVRLVTPTAVVVLTFRKKEVSHDDILTALLAAAEQVRVQAAGGG